MRELIPSTTVSSGPNSSSVSGPPLLPGRAG